MNDESGDGQFACFADEPNMLLACYNLLGSETSGVSTIQTTVAVGISLGFMLIAIVLVSAAATRPQLLLTNTISGGIWKQRIAGSQRAGVTAV